MPTLTQWVLPLNLPNPNPLYLQFLTELRNEKLFYTKQVVDVIGELDVSTNIDNVREWVVPPALSGKATLPGLADGITYGPNDRVWFALSNAHRLVELDPARGLFTAYGGAQYPIRYPRHLMFDGAGGLWYTGVGRNGALVGKLNPGRRTAVYWELPVELASPEGLWVDDAANEVWFTPINLNPMMAGAFLARLVPSTSELTYWAYGQVRPANAGVVGDSPRKAKNIWFTHDARGPASRIFRLSVSSGKFFEYAPRFSSPRKVALDDAGNAWVSDWQGKVITVPRDADCGQVSLTARKLRLEAKEMAVTARSVRQKPALHSVTPTQQPVVPAKVDCHVEFQLPFGLTSHGIQVDVGRRRPLNVYFTQPAGIVIGRLTP